MNLYYKYRQRFAIYVEFSKALGITPVLKTKKIKGELVVDIPFMQIIITPKEKLKAELPLSAHDTKNKNISTHFTHAPEN